MAGSIRLPGLNGGTVHPLLSHPTRFDANAVPRPRTRSLGVSARIASRGVPAPVTNTRRITQIVRERGLDPIARWAALAFVTFALAACGSTGGGSAGTGGGSASAAVAVDPVYLTPGATVAAIAWSPSQGPVDNYLVFESRNGSPYAFSSVSLTPSVDVVGQPGDTVQITVVAVSPLGETSENSHPSPPLVFQAAEGAAVVAQHAGGGATATPAPIGVAQTTATDDTTDNTTDNTTAGTTGDTTDATSNDATGNGPDAAPADERGADAFTQLVQSMRALLLGGNARLPEAGLSTSAQDWLQARVDHEIAAGVSLAGTGRENDDALRELIWRDPAGQLFVSDGEAFLDAGDLPATFAEALRLNATERFVGLDDFDGDARGDWILEDTATGEVWILSGGEADARALERSATDATLAGHGDFDGDGISELLWMNPDRALSLSSASPAAPSLVVGSQRPADVTLLAIADFDGDGRDDLLARADDGTLVVGFANVDPDASEGASVAFFWRNGSNAPVDALDLVATVDVDDDGSAEIAWLNGGELEIWSAQDGLERRIAL